MPVRNPSAYETWNVERAAGVIALRSREPGAMLPILHDLQAVFGCVPEAAVPMIAEALNLSRAEVHGVVTFYHDFREVPPGRHVLKLCRAEACQSMCGNDLSDHTRERLGLDWGQTSPDGAVTLEAVYCLGLCATAPSAMVDGKLVGRLTQAKLDRLIDQMSENGMWR